MLDNENFKMLIEMGFDEDLAKRALTINNNNFDQTMEWIIENANKPVASEAASAHLTNTTTPQTVLKLHTASVKETVHESSSSVDNSNTNTKETEHKPDESEQENLASEHANSLKCDECGKLLKDSDAATAHAYKTKHSSFSETVESIKPKTKEEIEEQKRLLSEKMVRLRQERQERERQEEIEREKQRRVQGRQIGEIRQKVQDDEMKRIAEERRREKLAAEAHKQRVKDQIAKDREQFKKKQETGEQQPEPVSAPIPQILNEKRSYDDCKIQIRLTDGKTMVQTFKAKEQLAAVRLWIRLNRTDDQGDFCLLQPFPRKQYTEDDMMQTLESLGLVPASSLIITRKP